jgi:hypothetical protein
MKKIQSSQATTTVLNELLRSLSIVLKSFFQSGSNRDFKRLKDFIAS